MRDHRSSLPPHPESQPRAQVRQQATEDQRLPQARSPPERPPPRHSSHGGKASPVSTNEVGAARPDRVYCEWHTERRRRPLDGLTPQDALHACELNEDTGEQSPPPDTMHRDHHPPFTRQRCPIRSLDRVELCQVLNFTLGSADQPTVKVLASIALSVSLVLVGTSSPANARDCVEVTRIGGSDAVARAVALAEATYPHGAETVLIARSDAYPDALAGGPLAAALKAPLLLTTPGAVAPQTRDAVEALGADHVVLLGGQAALSPAVASELSELGVNVERIGGGDRWTTAALVADRLRGLEGGQDLILAVGGHDSPSRGWPDAVAVSALAAAEGLPILLTGTDALPTVTESRLPEGGEVTIIGGTAVVADSVEQSLVDRGLAVRRLAGAHRFATSAAVVAAAEAAGADPQRNFVTDGTAFQEPLIAGPAAAAAGGVLRMIDPAAAPTLEGNVVLVGPSERLPSSVVGLACPPPPAAPTTPAPTTPAPITPAPTTPTTPAPTAPVLDPASPPLVAPSPVVTPTPALEPSPTPASGVPAPPPLAPSPSGLDAGIRYVRPGGKGDGSSWPEAAALVDLPVLVAASSPGDEVWIRGDEGPYRVTKPIVLRDGGSPGSPVVIRGVDAAGDMTTRPRIVGTRARPWTPGASQGNEVFRLLEGADHLAFAHLDFADIGNGCFRIGDDITDLALHDVTADNVRRFVEDYASGDARSATIRGLALRQITVNGFSRGVLRLGYDSSDVLLEDVVGDSQRQDGDAFAVGVHLEGTVHDVVHRRVTMRNAHYTGADYWNGDGFAAERGTHHLLYEDTVATGSTDAGYDLKAREVLMVRPMAGDNKRNYRFWAAGIDVRDCTATNPNRRGGSGSQTQVWVGSTTDVTLTDCTFTDSSPKTIVWHAEDEARLDVRTAEVSHHPDARRSVVEPDATLLVDGTPTRG